LAIGAPLAAACRAITAHPDVAYTQAEPPAASITVARSSASRSAL
jgi:hypothetical protein